MKSNETWLTRHITLHNHADAAAERENSLSHGLGVLGAVVFLFLVATGRENFLHGRTWVGMLVYAATLILLYASSTLYHSVPKSDAKRLFRVFDHANIYLLIAGTYTPILAFIGTTVAIRLILFVWAIAIAGIVFSLLFWERLKPLHVMFYLGMGWMIVFFWDKIVPYLPAGLLWWILAAGIFYTLGVIFYAVKQIPHNHMIWHIFCVFASAIFCIGFMIHLTS
ncbi:PAQR family membrane homeostasis protein TrhA [Pleomorphochaeta sp. DL1XJH-081]|jgi:hemolysin III|uniref:PAQR family membrane homeostasis protein TrhA n=1 Tax=Pleomorphochaeta sp. DL1XJH-081 TaxID=3409690 RepID=UPI003BB73B4E